MISNGRVLLSVLALVAILGVLSEHKAFGVAQQGPATELRRESLEMQKLRLENEKLEREIRSTNLQPWLQTGTLVAALIAAAVSFWSASRTQKSQADTLIAQASQYKQQRISDLFKELGSEDLGVRISAMQALSEYKEAAPFLVNVLGIDDEPRARETARTALQGMPSVALPLLIQAGRSLRERQLQIASELICLGVEKNEVSQAMSLDLPTLAAWMDTRYFRRASESTEAKLERLLRDTSSSVRQDLREKELRRIYESSASWHTGYENVRDTMEKVIAHASKDKEVHVLKGAYLPGILLDELDLSGWSFEDADLRDASFQRAILRKTNFTGTTGSGASFHDARLHDANFDRATLDDTDFRRAALHRAHFIESHGQNTRFQGAKMDSASFEGAKLLDGRFEGAFLVKAKFNGAKLFRSRLVAAVCVDADFSDTDLSGARLDDVIANRAKFINAVLAGVSIIKGRFNEAKFHNARLKAIEKYKGASFRNTEWTDARFAERTEEFQVYLRKSERTT